MLTHINCFSGKLSTFRQERFTSFSLVLIVLNVNILQTMILYVGRNASKIIGEKRMEKGREYWLAKVSSRDCWGLEHGSLCRQAVPVNGRGGSKERYLLRQNTAWKISSKHWRGKQHSSSKNRSLVLPSTGQENKVAHPKTDHWFFQALDRKTT